MHSYADIRAAKKHLGYLPTVGLDEGLARTVGHHRSERSAREGSP
jgi:nucleoside-diphosphate-sugar epimerase